MPTLLLGAFGTEQGASWPKPMPVVLCSRIRRMPHCSAAARLEFLTHLNEDLVRGCAHQRHQLSAVLQIHRAYAAMCLGIGRAVPVEIGSPGTPTVTAVLANSDLGVGRVVGAGHGTELPAD